MSTNKSGGPSASLSLPLQVVQHHDEQQEPAPNELLGELRKPQHAETAREHLERYDGNDHPGHLTETTARMDSPEYRYQQRLQQIGATVIGFSAVGVSHHQDTRDGRQGSAQDVRSDEHPFDWNAGKPCRRHIGAQQVQMNAESGAVQHYRGDCGEGGKDIKRDGDPCPGAVP